MINSYTYFPSFGVDTAMTPALTRAPAMRFAAVVLALAAMTAAVRAAPVFVPT
jgi:hypothetical protein